MPFLRIRINTRRIPNFDLAILGTRFEVRFFNSQWVVWDNLRSDVYETGLTENYCKERAAFFNIRDLMATK